MMDGIFGHHNFRSEIIWRRSASHNKISKQYGPIHDTILFYTKSDKFTFHPGRTPYTKSYVEKMFRYRDSKGAYRLNELTGSGKRSGESGKPWRDYDPSHRDRHWAVPASLRELLPDNGAGMGTHDMLDALDEAGEVVFSPEGRPTYKQRMGNGIPYQDIWSYQPGTKNVLVDTESEIDQDVKWLDAEEERLGYQTQKQSDCLSASSKRQQTKVKSSSTPSLVVARRSMRRIFSSANGLAVTSQFFLSASFATFS